MAKSITWKGSDAKFEIQRIENYQAALEVTPGYNQAELVCTNLSLHDLEGLIDILNDIRYELESEIERAEEKCNGNCGMNYCDENGCIDRKRELAEPIDPNL
jgi:hypothetical protein